MLSSIKYSPLFNYKQTLATIEEQRKEEDQESSKYFEMSDIPIIHRKIEIKFTCLAEVASYIKNKISNIVDIIVWLRGTKGQGIAINTILKGKQIFHNEIDLSNNCYGVSLALFLHLTTKKCPSYLGSKFRVCIVSINNKTNMLTLKKDSKNLSYVEDPSKNNNHVYHTYLTVQVPELSSYIIIDATTSNYNKEINLFVGSYSELLVSANQLMVKKKDNGENNYKFSELLFDSQRCLDEEKHIIEDWLDYGKGYSRDVASRHIEIWYQASMLDTVLARSS